MIRQALCVALLALVGFALVDYMQQPVPQTHEALRLKFSGWMAKIMYHVMVLGSDWGLYSQEAGARYYSDDIAKTTQNLVKEEWASFDGVPVKLYFPNNVKGKTPAWLYYHGGGFTVCKADTHDASSAHYADALGALVVSVEYPLRPENTIDDMYNASVKAAKYFIQHAAEYNVDPNKIIIGGGSAGGNLATVVSRYLRDEDIRPLPCLQVLLAGTFQTVDQTLPSYIQNKETLLIFRDAYNYLFSNYIAGQDWRTFYKVLEQHKHVPKSVREELKKYLDHEIIPLEHRYPPYKPPVYPEADQETWEKYKDVILDPRISPLLTEDLSGMPEAFIVSGQYDAIRDDSFLYAKRLREAGVKVTHFNYPIGTHSIQYFFQKYETGLYLKEVIIDFLKLHLQD